MKKITLLLCLFVLTAFFADAQNIEPKQNSKDSKWGFMDKSTGKWVLKPKYDNVEAISQQPNGKLRGKITAKGKTGFIDEYGKVLGAGVVFEEIIPIDSEAMIVTVKDKKGIVNYDGEYLIKPDLTSVEPLGTEGFIISKKDKKGFIKRNGSIVLDVIYNNIEPDVEGYFILDKGGKAALALRDGSILIEPKNYTSIEPFGEYWIVSKKDKKGLFDLNKKTLLIEPKYNDISQPFTLNGDEYFKVKKKDKWGVCDSSGKLIIKCKSKRLIIVPSLNAIYANSGWLFGEGLYMMPSKDFVSAIVEEEQVGPFELTNVRMRNGDHNILTNKEGNSYMTDGNIRELDKFYLVGCDKKNNNNLFSKDGKLIVSGVVDEPIGILDWNFLNISQDGSNVQYFVLSPERKLYPCKLIGNFMFTQNPENELWTDFDTLLNLNLDIPFNLNFTFEELKELSSQDKDLVCVKSDGMWGILDKKGYIINPVSDEPLNKLNDMLFIYYNNGKKGIVSAQKGEILKPMYDEIVKGGINNNQIRIKEGEYIGVFDIKNEKWIVPISDKYDRIDNFSDGYLAFKGNGKVQLYDINGKKITAAPKITVKEFYRDKGIAYSIAYQNCTESYYKVILRYYKGGQFSFFTEEEYKPTALSGNWGSHDIMWQGVAPGNYTVKLFVYDSEGKIVAQSNNSVKISLQRR